jgi:hypothetical protein
MRTMPTSAKGRSGRDIGADHAASLRRYLSTVNALPARDGKINMSAVALGAEFDRQVLYKNPKYARLLDEPSRRSVLPAWPPGMSPLWIRRSSFWSVGER